MTSLEPNRLPRAPRHGRTSPSDFAFQGSDRQRRHELGIRIALGASRKEVVRLVVVEGLRLASAALAVGILGAVAASRVAESLLGSLSAPYPGVYLIVPLLLAAVSARPVSLRRSGPRESIPW